MTNAEKFLKDGVDGGELVKELVKRVSHFDSCKYYSEEMEHEIVLFFEEQVKPTLTEDERVILRNIVYDSEYKYIYRSLGMLYLSENEKLTCLDRLPAMHRLFQFIKERRRI